MMRAARPASDPTQAPSSRGALQSETPRLEQHNSDSPVPRSNPPARNRRPQTSVQGKRLVGSPLSLASDHPPISGSNRGDLEDRRGMHPRSRSAGWAVGAAGEAGFSARASGLAT